MFELGEPMYDARLVANTLLLLASAERLAITNLKLQKLLYFAHGYYLEETGKPLVKNGFEAWGFGPVSRTAYQAFKKYDASPITDLAKPFNPVTQEYSSFSESLSDEALFVLEDVLHYFGHWPEFELVEFTHQVGSPWNIVWTEQNQLNVGMIIDDDVIRRNFEAPGRDEVVRENGRTPN